MSFRMLSALSRQRELWKSSSKRRGQPTIFLAVLMTLWSAFLWATLQLSTHRKTFSFSWSRWGVQFVLSVPSRQLLHLIPIGLLISYPDEPYHCFVVCEFDDGIAVVRRGAVMYKAGGSAHSPGGLRYWDWGMCNDSLETSYCDRTKTFTHVLVEFGSPSSPTVHQYAEDDGVESRAEVYK